MVKKHQKYIQVLSLLIYLRFKVICTKRCRLNVKLLFLLAVFNEYIPKEQSYNFELAVKGENVLKRTDNQEVSESCFSFHGYRLIAWLVDYRRCQQAIFVLKFFFVYTWRALLQQVPTSALFLSYFIYLGLK